jgi:hypothetical protein
MWGDPQAEMRGGALLSVGPRAITKDEDRSHHE